MSCLAHFCLTSLPPSLPFSFLYLYPYPYPYPYPFPFPDSNSAPRSPFRFLSPVSCLVACRFRGITGINKEILYIGIMN